MTLPRLVVADDSTLVLDSVQLLAERKHYIVAGTARNGEELVQVVEKKVPDVVLTDIMMPGMNGIEATRLIHERWPQLPVIAMTMFDAAYLIADMMKAGARGYLMKDVGLHGIGTAIDTVLQGDYYYCPYTNPKIPKLLGKGKQELHEAVLTEQEQAVVRLICQDYSAKEIADRMQLAKHTVDKYRGSIMEKIGVRGTAGIVLYALRTGLHRESQ